MTQPQKSKTQESNVNSNEYLEFPKGLSEEVVRRISKIKNEPEWMLKKRLEAFKIFNKKTIPTWGADLSEIDFQEIKYYATAGDNKHSWDDIPPEIKKTFDEIGVPEHEKKFLAGVSTQYESEVIYHNLLEQWKDFGIIFESIDEGLKKYPEIYKKYFGKLIPASDNKFAALNTAVWSGGSFVYVPKGVKMTIPVETYFRINTENMGQFERTLIIAEEDSEVTYIEGCFIAGSRVITNTGEKEIEKIAVGDKVLTHKGRFRKVYNTMTREYNGDIYSIRFWGDTGNILNITDQHPLLIARRKRKEYANKEFNLEWIEAKDANVSDYLVIPIRKVEKQQPLSYEVKTKLPGSHKTHKISIPEGADFFRLLGYYFAEGHASNEHYLTFSFSKEERSLIADCKRLCKKFLEKLPYENKERQNGISLILSSTKYSRLFTNVFGKVVYDKIMPEWIFNLDGAQKKELIKGMWLGDGSYDKTKKCFRYSSISRSLAYGFRDILLQLGIIATVNKQVRPSPKRDMYNVVVSSQNNELFGKIVNIKTKNGIKTGSPFVIDFDYLYVPIKKIDKIKSNLKVYNFSVEEDESYICEGVASHNCTAPQYSTQALHAAVVEIYCHKNSKVNYITIQNWSKNVYNLVTKRAMANEGAVMKWLDVNIGSKVTMKYPAVILQGDNSHGEVLSMALADSGQVLDTGAKMTHIGKNTTSIIDSKTVSVGSGKAVYRGISEIKKSAKNAKAFVACDGLLIDEESKSYAYPHNILGNTSSTLEHEAKVSKVSEEQLFYLMSRGMSEEEATQLIVAGFVDPVIAQLPDEYSVEFDRLLELILGRSGKGHQKTIKN